MEIVINKCFGGFGLSYKAVMEIAKRKGIKLFAYTTDYNGHVYPVSKKPESGCIHYTSKEVSDEKELNLNYYYTKWDRTDKDLIAVVKKLKKQANGHCASLGIVKIPDGIEFEIDDYDGRETVHEKHRSWS